MEENNSIENDQEFEVLPHAQNFMNISNEMFECLKNLFQIQSHPENTGKNEQNQIDFNGLLQLNHNIVKQKHCNEQLNELIQKVTRTNSMMSDRILIAKSLTSQLIRCLDLDNDLVPLNSSNQSQAMDCNNSEFESISTSSDNNYQNISHTSNGSQTRLEVLDRSRLLVGARLLVDVPPLSQQLLESSPLIVQIPDQPSVAPIFIRYVGHNFEELMRNKLRAEAIFNVYRIDSFIGISMGMKGKVFHFWFWKNYSSICPVCSKILPFNYKLENYCIRSHANHYTICDGKRVKVRTKLHLI